jgi:hypothetical protein
MPPGFSCVNLKEKIARNRFINTKKKKHLDASMKLCDPCFLQKNPDSLPKAKVSEE